MKQELYLSDILKLNITTTWRNTNFNGVGKIKSVGNGFDKSWGFQKKLECLRLRFNHL